jgi:tRNA-dihydrouridine synthase
MNFICSKVCSGDLVKELNWNLGCPYPMVTKSGMGSGLISNTEKINHILERAHTESDI